MTRTEANKLLQQLMPQLTDAIYAFGATHNMRDLKVAVQQARAEAVAVRVILSKAFLAEQAGDGR